MSECCQAQLSPRVAAMVAQLVAKDCQIAGYHAGQITIDFGPAEVRTKLQEVLPPVKLTL